MVASAMAAVTTKLSRATSKASIQRASLTLLPVTIIRLQYPVLIISNLSVHPVFYSDPSFLFYSHRQSIRLGLRSCRAAGSQ
jgi:hypothetical protein